MKFTVQHGGIKLKIEVLPTVEAVHKKYHDAVHTDDDEKFCTAIGLLTAQILNKLEDE